MPASSLACFATRHRYGDTLMDVDASGVVPGVGSMFRRLPSLRWVAVDGRYPNFIGTTQTLRLPLPRPAPASFPSPGLYHGCLIASLPRGRRCQRRRARTFVGGGRPRTAFSPVEDRGSPKFPHRPPCQDRSCSHEERKNQTELALSFRPTWPRLSERP